MSTHIVPVETYRRIFFILIGLTLVTVLVSFIDLGFVNPVVALGIATTKAALVTGYFMHLKFSDRITKVAFLTAVGGVIVLFGISVDDELTRTSTTFLPAPAIPPDGEHQVMGLDGAVPPSP